MKSKDLIKEIRTLLTKDFKSDNNYDDLKHDIIAEINSSSRSLDDQELEAITQKQYFESRTSLSDTSLCLSYVAVILSFFVSLRITSWLDVVAIVLLILDLLATGCLVILRLIQQKKYNKYVLYYIAKLYCINQIREERKNIDTYHCKD